MDAFVVFLGLGGAGLLLGVAAASMCRRGRVLILIAGIAWVVLVVWMFWQFDRCSGLTNTCGETADLFAFWIAVGNGIGFSLGALTSHLFRRKARDRHEASRT